MSNPVPTPVGWSVMVEVEEGDWFSTEYRGSIKCYHYRYHYRYRYRSLGLD